MVNTTPRPYRRVGLDWTGAEILPSPGFDTRTVHPLASRNSEISRPYNQEVAECCSQIGLSHFKLLSILPFIIILSIH